MKDEPNNTYIDRSLKILDEIMSAELFIIENEKEMNKLVGGNGEADYHDTLIRIEDTAKNSGFTSSEEKAMEKIQENLYNANSAILDLKDQWAQVDQYYGTFCEYEKVQNKSCRCCDADFWWLSLVCYDFEIFFNKDDFTTAYYIVCTDCAGVHSSPDLGDIVIDIQVPTNTTNEELF